MAWTRRSSETGLEKPIQCVADVLLGVQFVFRFLPSDIIRVATILDIRTACFVS